jgi:hypothetical protein
MLLGFVVSERGTEANPEKIAAITSMGLIQNIKGVQRVTGCLAALTDSLPGNRAYLSISFRRSQSTLPGPQKRRKH